MITRYISGHRFDGKVAFLTGSAAAYESELIGFGGATAWRFFREGGKSVVLTDVEDVRGERSAVQMRDAGFDALYLHLDVTDERGWNAAIDETLTRFGRLDVLVNIAGILDPGPISETSLEEWKRVLDVTNVGCFLGTKLGAAAMRQTGGGSIINLSSMAAHMSGAYGAAYAASRSGIIRFTKSAAVQYAADNVRVNAVLPGWVHSPFTDHLYRDRRQRRSREERVPLGRFGTPEEIAAGILFLASDEASYVTGTELTMDGGVTAGSS